MNKSERGLLEQLSASDVMTAPSGGSETQFIF